MRTAVRKELEWEGFAMLGPGMLAHPAAAPEALHDARSAPGRRARCSCSTPANSPRLARVRWASLSAKAGT
ncbi:hypothetical protein [Massilia sp. Dwa41.01b]|uniref:hypothetical protein n=1 Tax=Massilia sp. Dwa41.01b TaxID=2709302 RepID=UPI0035A69989